ncbi:MAG: lipopolysaccharide kinase InaA family protein [Thermodesulfobacteriota bacterium]|nr:lipopolysaccharide kinase InaA family protein [Thermodesulfobacteriota bacterium]
MDLKRESLIGLYPEHRWEIVQAQAHREVYRLVCNGEIDLYAKVNIPSGIFSRIRGVFNPNTLHEARMLKNMHASGIPVPGVEGHYRKGSASMLITEAIEPSRHLYEIPAGLQPSVMMDMARGLLLQGFFFTDMHPGNIIIDPFGMPWLLDVYEAKEVRRITPRHVVALFAQVISQYPMDGEKISTYLPGLCPKAGQSSMVRKIQTRAVDEKKRFVKRRIKSCIRAGSFTRRIDTRDYKAIVFKDSPIDIDQIMSGHWENIQQKKGVLKYQAKTQLSVVDEYCVKSYRSSRRFTTPYAMRSWKGLLTLYFNGISVAGPVAIIVYKDQTSALITRILEYPDLDRYIFHAYASLDQRQRFFIASGLGKTIGRMHNLHILHYDLKACNIKVEKDTPGFYFLDTDRVVQSGPISGRLKLRNLVQLNTSIPLRVSRSERMTFIRAYADETKDAPRATFRKVWMSSKDKGIVYCTDQGDCFEEWS